MQTDKPIKNFEETLYIGVGREGCFFTMRQTYLAEINVNKRIRYEIRHYHHFNLSQNPDDAYSKALEYAAKSGMRLTTTRESLEDELNEIKRANADEMLKREQYAKQQKEDWEAQRKEEIQRNLDVINAGFFPFGKFTGIAFEKADRGYVQWLMNKVNDFEENSLMRIISEKLNKDYIELKASEYLKDVFLGEEGQRLEIEVEIVKTFTFVSTFGPLYIVTMVTPDKICIVSKGSFSAKIGEKLKIKATIKNHNIYKEQAQTIVNRVKIL